MAINILEEQILSSKVVDLMVTYIKLQIIFILT